jgi:hypothetical protein
MMRRFLAGSCPKTLFEFPRHLLNSNEEEAALAVIVIDFPAFTIVSTDGLTLPPVAVDTVSVCWANLYSTSIL